MTIRKTRSTTIVTAMAMATFLGGTVPWIFPLRVASVLGVWVVPTFSILSLMFAFVLAEEWPRLRTFLIILAVTLVLGWIRAPSSVTGNSHFVGASIGLLVMVLVGNVAGTPRGLRIAIITFLVGGLCVLGLGLVAVDVRSLLPTGSAMADTRGWVRLSLTGLKDGFVNPNALAAAALLIGPLGASVVCMESGSRITRFFLQSLGILTLTAALMVLIISRSRTGWLALWLTLVAILTGGFAQRSWRVIIGAVVAAAPLAATLSVHLVARDAFLVQAGELWTSVDNRAHVMTAGAAEWRQAPWLGIGLNRFRQVYVPLPGYEGYDVAHAHNMYIQTALDVGTIGLGAYCGVMILLFSLAGRARRGPLRLGANIATGSMLSWVAVSFFGLADAVALGSKIGLFQWMAAGMILAAARTQSALSAPEPVTAQDHDTV